MNNQNTFSELWTMNKNFLSFMDSSTTYIKTFGEKICQSFKFVNKNKLLSKSTLNDVQYIRF